MPINNDTIVRYYQIISDEGYVILSAAVWMTWYTARWAYDWVELDRPNPGALSVNWKSFIVMRGH